MAKSNFKKPWLTLVIGLLLLGSLYLIFWRTPSEQQMGVVYKIFYFHVGSAMASLILFLVCSFASAGYLIMRRMKGYRALSAKAERLAFAMAEVGVVFGLIVLDVTLHASNERLAEFFILDGRVSNFTQRHDGILVIVPVKRQFLTCRNLARSLPCK